MVCSGVEPEKNVSEKSANWIREIWRKGRTVGGLCTGACTLARAGILEGIPCTVHWGNLGSFSELFPKLDVVDQLYCSQRRVMSCGGGSGAIDLMVSIIHREHGVALADEELSMCLHHTLRPESTRQRSSTAALLGSRNPKLAAIVEYMHEYIDEKISMSDISHRFDLSQRQIERLFLRHVGTSSKRYLLQQRLERARALLADTNMPVGDVAVSSGFASVSQFSKQFRDRFGQSPWKFSVSRGV